MGGFDASFEVEAYQYCDCCVNGTTFNHWLDSYKCKIILFDLRNFYNYVWSPCELDNHTHLSD